MSALKQTFRSLGQKLHLNVWGLLFDVVNSYSPYNCVILEVDSLLIYLRPNSVIYVANFPDWGKC